MRHAARIKAKTARPKTAPPVRRQIKTPSVSRLTLVQPALLVGSVSDPAEREAEVMAARVVGASAPSTDTTPPPSEGPKNPPAAALRRSAEDQPNLDELKPEPAGGEQADFDLPKAEDVAPDGLKAADMGELESGSPEETAADGAVAPLRRAQAPEAVVGRMGGTAPSDVSSHVANPGPGRPLPSGLRARVEPHFQRSFEDVRLHDAPADQDAAARIGARAFTHKNRIWLGRGESPTNTRLMAHELTHVVQQTDGSEALPLERTPLRREDEEGILEGKLEGYARYVPGYTLATVILGKTMISGRKVLKTAENLLGGLFGLHPLGTVLFDKLRETKMVTEAFDWVEGRLGDLNLTWSRVRAIIDKIWDAPLVGAVDYVIDLFKPITRDLITFAKDVAKKVLEFAVRGALKLAGPYADKVWGIIQQAGDVLDLIVKDPLGFAKNLVKAVVGGFGRFAKNILDHLKKGLLGWIFGAIAKAGITMPEKLDFKGLMSLVMQILGLTYAAFRKQLVKKLGPSGERKVTMIEKSVEIVKILLKEGFAGIWRKMLELIENFKTTLIGGMTEMVITTVVKVGLSWLAGLSNPVGAIVKVVLSIYDLIVAFLERLEQIMDVAKSIFSSVGAIAKGQVEAASKFVEETIGRTVPVVLAFLAAVLGLNSIPSKIQKVIRKLQKPVQKAMGKLIGFVVKKAKKLWSKLIKKLNKKRKYPSYDFKIGKADHRIFAKKEGKKLITLISSDEEGTPKQHQEATDEQTADAPDPKVPNQVEQAAGDAQAETTQVTRNVKPDTKKKNNRVDFAKIHDEYVEAGKEFQALSVAILADQHLTEFVPGLGLLRSNPDRRFPDLEGQVMPYTELKKKKGEVMGDQPEEIKKKYELDHVVEKQYPYNILNNLDKLKPQNPNGRRRLFREPPKTADGNKQRVSRNSTKSTPPFGLLGTGDYKSISADGDVLPAVAVYKPNHVRVTGGLAASAKSLIETSLTKPHPAAYIRKGLEEQTELEIKSLRNMSTKDNALTGADGEKIREALRSASNMIMLENIQLYGLKKVNTDQSNDPEAPENDNTMPMEGNDKAPNFAQHEGTGRYYKQRLSGIAGYLENDHILDDAYARRASQLPLLSGVGKSSVARTANIADAPEGSTKRKRLDHLFAAKLFSGTASFASYGSDDGYTAALFKTLADRVTARVATPDLGNLMRSPPGKAVDAFSKYVHAGTNAEAATEFKKGVDTLRVEVKGHLNDQVDLHGGVIKDVYAAGRQEMVGANPDNAAAAEKAYSAIEARLRKTITDARNVNNSFISRSDDPAVL